MRMRSFSAWRGKSMPSTLTLPSLGVSKPVKRRIDVDLPEPFGPRKP
jgi:hypothetical protein